MVRSRLLSGGVAITFGLVMIFSAMPSAGAINTLLEHKKPSANTAPKAVFLVSRPSKDITLEKYQNATSLTDLQLVELLKAVGFSGKGLRIAYAVAKAESNGRPYAYNGNIKTLDQSYGVFQINMLNMLGEDRRERFNLDHNADLFNPVINAQIAYRMTKGGIDWSSWSSYNKGAINKWLDKFPNQ